MRVTSPEIKASFPVRRMDYDFAYDQRYWIANDPATTHYFTALSLLFPEGEKYFVEAVRAVRGMVKDHPQLDKDIGAFIGQEAMHSKEHHAFHLAAAKTGLDPASLEKMVGDVLAKYFTFQSKQLNLAITVGLEHFTAVMVVKMMKDTVDKMTDDTIRDLWLWHSIEETEHKAVAFDVYQQIYGDDVGSYAVRVAMFGLGVFALFAMQSNMMARLMYRDKQLLNIKSWRKFGGLMREGFGEMTPKFLEYFRRDFHPNQHDDSALVALTKQKIGLSAARQALPYVEQAHVVLS